MEPLRDSGEHCAVAVIGGGAAGLTAAFREYSDGFADKILQMIAYIIVKVP